MEYEYIFFILFFLFAQFAAPTHRLFRRQENHLVINVIEAPYIKYEKSKLSSDILDLHFITLQNYLEQDKPFLNPDFCLNTVSDKLNIPSHQLSQVINARFEKSFSELTNYYRIKEVKEKIKDSRNDHLTIEGLAYDCGYSSKSAFNASFKKQTGVTPTVFKKLEALG